METRRFQDLTYTLQRSPRRQTLGLTIERDGTLIVAAPETCSDRAIQKMLSDRQFWIYAKLARQESLTAGSVQREITSGQGFLYLGRHYRLRVISSAEAKQIGQKEPLRWHQGFFNLLKSERANGREHFRNWYARHAQAKLPERAALYTAQLEATPNDVRVRDLGYRWGSCTQSGILHFNWRLIMAPIRIVDYVVVHEMIHLLLPNHTPDFWKLFRRTMPDYLERKQSLAEHGAEWNL